MALAGIPVNSVAQIIETTAVLLGSGTTEVIAETVRLVEVVATSAGGTATFTLQDKSGTPAPFFKDQSVEPGSPFVARLDNIMPGGIDVIASAGATIWFRCKVAK